MNSKKIKVQRRLERIRNLNKILILSLLLIVLSSISAVSAADTDLLTDTNDDVTEVGTFHELQQLIDNSETNSVTLDKDYTYNSSTDGSHINGITINKADFVINGNNHTINGDSKARIISFSGTGTISLTELNLLNGKTNSNGGAIYSINNGNVRLTSCEIINNTAKINGGGIYTQGRVISIISQIIGNDATIGSGVYAKQAILQYNIITQNSNKNKVIYGEDTTTSDISFNWWGVNKPNIEQLSNILTDSFVQATANHYDNIMVNLTSPIVVNLDSYVKGNKSYYLGVDLPKDHVIFSTNFGNLTETDVEIVNGEASTTLKSNTEGNATITAFIDDEVLDINIEITPVPNTTLLNANDFVEYYGEGEYYKINLTDILGRPIIGQHLALNLTRLTNNLSKVYYSTNDWTGEARLQINLAPGWYTVQAHFYSANGYEESALNNSIHVLRVGLTAEDIIINKGETANYEVTLTGPQTVSYQQIQVTLTGNGITNSYTIITNQSGVATLSIPNLNTGTYTVTAKYKDNDATSYIKVQNKYTLTILNWGTGGDIRKNTVLYNYLLQTTSRNGIVDEIIAAEKQGTVLIKFGNGNGRTVFINAGIHGNELPSQAAAYQTAEYLSSLDEINGTIYMICSLIPYTAQQSVREYNGVDPNRQAKVAGSVANKLINLAVSLNVETFADMHGTKYGGLPGKNVIMAAYTPNSESATMANYMYNLIGYVDLQIVDYAGQVYPTALQDNVNLAGIPAVTGEVLCQHSTINNDSTEISYAYHMAFLKYNGFNVSFNSNPN